ncbi:hypothetical protein FisN_8Hh057 [Fistulifera solaris]|uniref:Uncharacterized protein n=1 Tax=Fistulifera solaris TaxID=1519565 RepID=A0A1Z5JJK6_FISSO|nr:hypothetical protein FisN_8Hh057 [Fistulifera solaris]|eukprot:GAX14106.1 hypothetical protein FisN_8Hh057 [Fistulifera solaris]
MVTGCLLALSILGSCQGFSLYSPSLQRTVLFTSQQSPSKHHLPSRLFLSPDASDAKRSDNPELTVSKIAELVDLSFVPACLQLAEGYVDVLKLMIAAVQSAYVQGIPPALLIQEINALTTPGAGRPLMPEEEQLRNEWIQIVYITLQTLKYKNLPHSFPTEIQETFGMAAPVLIRRRQWSSEWKGQEVWESCSQFFAPTQPKALIMQSLRVLWVTLSVVEEVERCEGEFAKMDAPLTPPIPAAFEKNTEFLP